MNALRKHLALHWQSWLFMTSVLLLVCQLSSCASLPPPVITPPNVLPPAPLMQPCPRPPALSAPHPTYGDLVLTLKQLYDSYGACAGDHYNLQQWLLGAPHDP